MTLENLSHLLAFKVSGSDAQDFLQGQLSNDIKQLDKGWQYNAYCTPKGRALASLITWSDGKGIYLLIDQSVAQATVKRLQMFVMRSDVTFSELDAQVLGAFELTDVLKFAPELSADDILHHCHIDEKAHVLSFEGRYMVINFSVLTEPEEANLKIVDDGHRWIEADILQAQPRVTSRSSELFIPQMLNMDLLNGINFKKGCYTGQEIIARMRYLGKLKQRLFVCKVNEHSTSNEAQISSNNIGDKITDNDGKTVGNIVNAADTIAYVTAVLRMDNLDNGLHTEAGLSFSVEKQQPYSLDTK